MSVVQAIQTRRSVRAYTSQPLSRHHVKSIQAFIAATQPPWNVLARIELVHADIGAEPRKLGSYGSVRGARDFMGLVYADGPLAAEAAAYWFEQVLLHCTSLGIGTCWLAGFTSSSFLKDVVLTPGESVRYASPVGYSGGPKPMIQRLGLFNAEKKHVTRKPFEQLFFKDDFTTPLTPETAGLLVEPLQMVRLAPSAMNHQPYCAVVTADPSATFCHFFIKPTNHAHTDIGIALAHFDLTCQELGLPGHLEVTDTHPTQGGLDYVISWVK